MDVEACVTPGEGFLDKGKGDELFPKQQGKDLMGEGLKDGHIIKAGDMLEGDIRGCDSFCNQYMDMRMEIDAIS